MAYLKWGWPLVLADAALAQWAGEPASRWRSLVNLAAFGWVLCAPAAPLSLLLDRERRERAMARLCGLREGDERERVVTGEAARATLLFGLSLEVVLLVMTMVSVRLSWDPHVPKDEKHGTLSVGMSFDSARHLDPFGAAKEKSQVLRLGAPPEAEGDEIHLAGGFLLAPSAFPVLALLVLLQLAAFKGFALRRYEGTDA
jgi:hypothetical protein